MPSRGTRALALDVALNDDERALGLAGLFDLRITRFEDDALWAESLR